MSENRSGDFLTDTDVCDVTDTDNKRIILRINFIYEDMYRKREINKTMHRRT